MLDSRRLTTLEAVFRTGSFAAAAEDLGYTPAAVSQHIAELERATGLQLLKRRPVRPTDAGLVALQAAHAAGEAIAAAETVLRALRDGDAGTVRLGAFASAASALAAPAIAELADSHPQLEVTLVQVETPDAYEALIHDALDLAVTFEYVRDPHEPPEPILRTMLFEDPILAALPANSALAGRPIIALRELADEAWIAAPLAGLPLSALRNEHRAGFRQRLRFDGDDFRTVLALVATGLGIALIPRLAARDIPQEVTIRPLSDAALTRRLYTARLPTSVARPAITAVESAIRRQRPETTSLQR